MPPEDYADFVLATSTIEETLRLWAQRGTNGIMAFVQGFDAVTVIRRALLLCPDEYPDSSTTELAFIEDEGLRDSIRRDLAASSRALNNAEWKAATVLAGAAIEALLLWRLRLADPGSERIDRALQTLVSEGVCKRSGEAIDRWSLHQFIEVAAHLKIISADTASAAKLTQNFRNLIHPGRAERVQQACDRGTAFSAIGAAEHVVRDLSRKAKQTL